MEREKAHSKRPILLRVFFLCACEEMSGGYADRLTKGVDYGECGTPERVDNPRVLSHRINRLAELIKKSQYIVAHTGAGSSLPILLPDF